MTTYVIREWVGDHENVNTLPVHTPHVVLVALESVFNVAIPNNALAWLTILNIGSQIMMVGKRGEKNRHNYTGCAYRVVLAKPQIAV